MNILKRILNKPELAEKIRLKCDIELYPELQNLYLAKKIKIKKEVK